MAPRKRNRDEMESSEPPKEMSLLDKIRNMWEFASVMQYIFTFGKAMKIDEDFDIEDFETECLKPSPSDKLEEIGLTLLKWISSHRGLNFEIWDEYTRRQYLAKAPHLNPYGGEEKPKKFRTFDIFQKIRILHQLTVWTFWNPDRIRERMPDHPREADQLEWRIEELGYDREDRQYYILDDNRLYRRTDPPLPALPKAKPKANTLKAQAARRRANKRRRIEDSETPDVSVRDEEGTSLRDDSVENIEPETPNNQPPTENIDTFGGYKWELIAITLSQYQEFCESLRKSKDANEKILRQRILDDVIPIIQGAEEKQRRKAERREKELLSLQMMARAKRSSRIADRIERERHENEAADAERKRAADLAAAHREKERQEKMEQERQSRMMTREQRIRDREYKRLLKEEELAKMAEEAKKIESGESRASERQVKESIERKKKDLEELAAEEDWTFDCSGCGMHGKNLDDGSHSVACEKCNVWQHSKCLGISKAAAEKDNFHFVCKDCQRRTEDANKPKISLKFRAGLSSSPPQQKSQNGSAQSLAKQKFSIEIPKKRGPGRPRKTSVHNGYPNPQSSSPTLQTSSPYLQRPILQNGYSPYTSRQPQTNGSPQHSLYANGFQPTGPGSPLSASIRYPNQPVPPQNGYEPRPESFPRRTFELPPYQFAPASNSSFIRPSPSHGQHPPYYNGIPHQYQSYPAAPARPPSQISPRLQPSQLNNNGPSFPTNPHIPSPIFNRPTMSPTQGNYDVGPIAGVPQRSPSLGHAPSLFTPSQSPTSPSSRQPHPQASGTPLHTTPTPIPLSQIPNPNPSAPHLSGLSPIKHSPIPPPSHIPQKLSFSPPPPGSAMRSISGTPVIPPTERLVPSPTQLNDVPLPTPSKHDPSTKVGGDGLGIVNEAEVKEEVKV